jgi:hypothetical protein
MFLKHIHYYLDRKNYYTIIDTDFIEEPIQSNSVWDTIIEIYSKRNLNVYGNFAIALKQFCGRTQYTIDSMLEWFGEKDRSHINIEELKKILINNVGVCRT